MSLVTVLVSVWLAAASAHAATPAPVAAPIPVQPGAAPIPTQPLAAQPAATTPEPPVNSEEDSGPSSPPETPPPGPPPVGQPYVPPPPPVDIDATIRAAYVNAENQQGPLDGRWRLSGAKDAPLFAFVMSDTGGAPAPRATTPSDPQIEGAWRDLRREGGIRTSGLLVSVEHLADLVEIRFYEADPSSPTVVKLRTDANGVWSGDLVEAGATTPVVMKRF